jgi:mono/diheme cytochrome c family protein
MRWALPVILGATALVASCGSEPPATDPVARGAQVYRELDCGACHEAGLRNLWRPVGPPLEHVGTAAQTRRPGVPADQYLRQSVTDPGAFLVPGYPDSMPRGLAGRLTQEDLDALVRYLASLR